MPGILATVGLSAVPLHMYMYTWLVLAKYGELEWCGRMKNKVTMTTGQTENKIEKRLRFDLQHQYHSNYPGYTNAFLIQKIKFRSYK